MNKTLFAVTEVLSITGLNQQQVTLWIDKEWVTPSEPFWFDTEDVARLQFIKDMIYDLGANEDSIPILLHLIDQLYRTREELRRARSQV